MEKLHFLQSWLASIDSANAKVFISILWFDCAMVILFSVPVFYAALLNSFVWDNFADVIIFGRGPMFLKFSSIQWYQMKSFHFMMVEK